MTARYRVVGDNWTAARDGNTDTVESVWNIGHRGGEASAPDAKDWRVMWLRERYVKAKLPKGEVCPPRAMCELSRLINRNS